MPSGLKRVFVLGKDVTKVDKEGNVYSTKEKIERMRSNPERVRFAKDGEVPSERAIRKQKKEERDNELALKKKKLGHKETHFSRKVSEKMRELKEKNGLDKVGLDHYNNLKHAVEKELLKKDGIKNTKKDVNGFVENYFYTKIVRKTRA